MRCPLLAQCGHSGAAVQEFLRRSSPGTRHHGLLVALWKRSPAPAVPMHTRRTPRGDGEEAAGHGDHDARPTGGHSCASLLRALLHELHELKRIATLAASSGVWCPSPRHNLPDSDAGRPRGPMHSISWIIWSRCGIVPGRCRRRGTGGWATRPGNRSRVLGTSRGCPARRRLYGRCVLTR